MRLSWIAATLVSALFLCLPGLAGRPAQAQTPGQPRNNPAADTLILHGRIYTMNRSQPWVEAVAIRGDKILAIGSDYEIAKLAGAQTKVIDAQNHLVMPGFVDCHIHFMDGSLSLNRVNLEGAKDVAEIQQRLRDYAAKHSDDGWVLGRGWDYAMFGAAHLPDKKYLDEVFPDRPAFIEGYDGHTYWADSKALGLAGVTKDTKDPANGVIVRDPQTSEPTGALKEAAAELVRKVVPQPSRGERVAALHAGIRWANQNGLTRVHSAGGDFEQLDLFDEIRQHGDLTLRFYIAYFQDPPEMREEDLAAMQMAQEKYHDDWIDTNATKFMVDGVIESHTAAMLEPYIDDPSTKGKLFWDVEKYKGAVTELDRRGRQIFTHAIGDYGIRTALDAYETAARVNHTRDRRSRVEHIESIQASDIPRFGKLGVIASMQPLHSYPNNDTLTVWAGNIGADRASRAWVWKSIESDGGKLAFGSDWPVVTLNPWEGLQTAVTRQTSDGQPAGGFVPSQRLSIADAVEAYTLGAAFAGRREKTEGSLEAGKAADLIIVSQNIFQIDPHKIGQTRVLTTMVAGKVVYQAADQP